MRMHKNPKFALDVTGLVLAAALFALASRLRTPWLNLCLGIGTSFVFIAVSDILHAAHARILDASRALGSSACTYLYFDHSGANALFELKPEPSGGAAKMYIETIDGREFHSDSHLQYGLIARYAPDRIHGPHRRWFLIAGLGPAGTVGAAWYLAQNWRYLARKIPADQDFAALVTVPVLGPTASYLQAADIVLPRSLAKTPATAGQQAAGITS